MKVVRWFIRSHPRAASFVGLAAAMVLILLMAAREVGLEPGQQATLVVSTVIVAGLCIWIIHWD